MARTSKNFVLSLTLIWDLEVEAMTSVHHLNERSGDILLFYKKQRVASSLEIRLTVICWRSVGVRGPETAVHRAAAPWAELKAQSQERAVAYVSSAKTFTSF